MPSPRLLSEFLLDLNTSVIIDLKILTKVLLRIGESIYTETWNYNMNRNNM